MMVFSSLIYLLSRSMGARDVYMCTRRLAWARCSIHMEDVTRRVGIEILLSMTRVH